MKNSNKGFIQIPLLITVVLGIIAIGSTGYVGVEKYIESKVDQKISEKEQLNENIATSTPAENNTQKEDIEREEKPIINTETIIKEIIKEVPVYVEKEDQTMITPRKENLEITSITAIPSAYSAEIKWNTTLISNSKITLWPTNTEDGNLTRNTYNTKNHSVTINLLPNKTYYYTIEVDDGNGNLAFSEQKEFKTPTDNISPTTEKIDITSEKDKGVINFTIHANEPIRAILTYNFKYSPEAGGDKETTEQNIIYDKELKKYVIDKNYYNPYTITIPKPSYTGSTELNYSLDITDQSGNLTFEDGNIKVYAIEGI